MNDTGKNIGVNANKVRKVLAANDYQEVVSLILRGSDSAVNPRFSVRDENGGTRFLRDCMEMPLRKLADRAMPKIFEIGPCFRQEPPDDTHREEFYMMELYSVEEGLAEMKTLTEAIVSEITGVPVPSKSISLADIILEDIGVDIRAAATEELISAIKTKYSKLSDDKQYQIVNEYIGLLSESICKEKGVLYFLEEYPACTIDSAARHGNANTIRRFEAHLNGLEIAHAFVDCMDAADIKARAAGEEIEDKETLELIQDTEQGRLLPTVGLGIGINRLCMAQGGDCNGEGKEY